MEIRPSPKIASSFTSFSCFSIFAIVSVLWFWPKSTLAGTLSAGSQTGISAVGTLSSLTSNGNVNINEHDGSTKGLQLAGTLVTSTASDLNKLAGVTGVVNNWLDGDLNAFDDLHVMQLGGEFRQSCWKALRKVKAGKIITYAQLAHKAGNINAVRAAGSACAKNLIAPFVPCHRVIKTGGTIGNYAFGVTLKEALLTHEGFHNLR